MFILEDEEEQEEEDESPDAERIATALGLLRRIRKRVRDGEGRVIGLASKMSGNVAVSTQRARENTDWMVLIPSRGALLTSTEGRPADTSRVYPPERMGLDLVRRLFFIFAHRRFGEPREIELNIVVHVRNGL